MSWETIGGIFGGVGLFIFAIVLNTDNYWMFFSVSSFVMVMGGTFAASFISYNGRYVTRSLTQLVQILFPSNVNPQTLFQNVGMIIKWSIILRKQGIPALETITKGTKIDDDFVKYGVNLLMMNYEGGELRDMLENFMDTTYERAMVQSEILKTMSSIAPAFGMIGTLVGLIIMLDSMGTDPGSIGKGLAIALLTTLYGILVAQLIFKPASLKIAQKESMMKFRNSLLVEGFVLLSERKNPAVIQDALNSFLDPRFHFKIATKDLDIPEAKEKKKPLFS
ncbi:MAG: MotA/TolQ/ExbB proton channel family protein [Nitrospinae bacterium]|nr:MotA/TolQ/ExbB proton channel family protein [Nitrospinota bacterium]